MSKESLFYGLLNHYRPEKSFSKEELLRSHGQRGLTSVCDGFIRCLLGLAELHFPEFPFLYVSCENRLGGMREFWWPKWNSSHFVTHCVFADLLIHLVGVRE